MNSTTWQRAYLDSLANALACEMNHDDDRASWHRINADVYLRAFGRALSKEAQS